MYTICTKWPQTGAWWPWFLFLSIYTPRLQQCSLAFCTLLMLSSLVDRIHLCPCLDNGFPFEAFLLFSGLMSAIRHFILNSCGTLKYGVPGDLKSFRDAAFCLITSFFTMDLNLFVCLFVFQYSLFSASPCQINTKDVLGEALCSVDRPWLFLSFQLQKQHSGLIVPTSSLPFPLLSVIAQFFCFFLRDIFIHWLYFLNSLYFSFCPNQLEQQSINKIVLISKDWRLISTIS